MAIKRMRRWMRRLLIGGLIFLALLLVAVFIVADFYIEPLLKQRLQTLIVDGSDSLYTYKLGGLKTSVFGGRVEIIDLSVTIDSNRYATLKARGSLPALSVQLNVYNASIRGINLFALLFSKKILIDEISSKDADIKLTRNFKNKDTVAKQNVPLWQAVRPKIKDLGVNRIKLDGVRLLYQNEDVSEAENLQFDRCDAELKNIRIDSAAVVDTSRIGYVENFSFRLQGLKFRTPDSTYQMNAAQIRYNSEDRLLQVDSFNLKPTLSKEARKDSLQKGWYTVAFNKVSFIGLRLDRYLRLNRAEADSVVFDGPSLSIYSDKSGEKNYRSKIGHYPQQDLLNARTTIAIKKFIARNMRMEVIEKEAETGQEGTIALSDLNVTVENIVNDSVLIRQNPIAKAQASGKLIGSPVEASFRFYLDSTEGKFDVKGSLKNVSAAQINPLSSTLANVEVPSAQIESIDFFVRGYDYGATSDVAMQYHSLSVVFMKRDKETGENSTRNFLTKLLNKYAIYTSNPASGAERRAYGVKVSRLTTQSFFGVIWQAVFAGMQGIILKAG